MSVHNVNESDKSDNTRNKSLPGICADMLQYERNANVSFSKEIDRRRNSRKRAPGSPGEREREGLERDDRKNILKRSYLGKQLSETRLICEHGSILSKGFDRKVTRRTVAPEMSLRYETNRCWPTWWMDGWIKIPIWGGVIDLALGRDQRLTAFECKPLMGRPIG